MACYSWWHQIFETDGRIVKRRLDVFLKRFCTQCEEERSHTVSLQKFINEIPSESRHWSFRSLPLNKPFSVIFNPAFTEPNKAVEHLQKASEKRATLQKFCSCEKYMRELNILSRTEVGSNLYHADTKNHQGGIGDSEDESDSKIFSVSHSETGQQSAPRIQLELTPGQPQQG